VCPKPFRHTKDERLVLMVSLLFFFKGADVSLVYGFTDIFIAAGNFSTPILQGSCKCSAAGILAAI